MKNGKIDSITNKGTTPSVNVKYEVIIDAGKVVGTRNENLVKILITSDGGMMSAYPIK